MWGYITLIWSKASILAKVNLSLPRDLLSSWPHLSALPFFTIDLRSIEPPFVIPLPLILLLTLLAVILVLLKIILDQACVLLVGVAI